MCGVIVLCVSIQERECVMCMNGRLVDNALVMATL